MKIMEWYEKEKLKNNLMRTFKLGDIYKEYVTKKGKKFKRYPSIKQVTIDRVNNKIEFVFVLEAINPSLVFNQKWLFNQTLGKVSLLTTYDSKHIILIVEG